ncbi:fibroblast growth factor-binding protein 1-like [Brienomyrus brachyistius]|uniref:fibroblast growth factor-binding protein 1-like n=1 Tax=Brienomyrus brachyistius TaxID=42636 RepID=UPI0020B2FACF|nr:fibroblast growth factor-binding protein 1-like [Brienomyrus brachyistius]
MMIFNNFVLLLLVACIAQQVFVVESEKGQGRKGEGKGKGAGKKEATPEKPPAAPRGSDKGQKTRGGKEAFKGKFSTKDKKQCTWAANGEDKFTLGVTCKKGGETFNCEYTATPAKCPQYAPNVKMYWKQIARALKKQKTLCQDVNAIIKTGVCKKAPKDAHFRLNLAPQATEIAPASVSSKGNKTCTEDVDNEKRAEEYCNGSWSSLCTFFFSMVQNGDC